MCVLSGGEDPCAAPQGGSGRCKGGLSGRVSGSGVPHHDPVNGKKLFLGGCFGNK